MALAVVLVVAAVAIYFLTREEEVAEDPEGQGLVFEAGSDGEVIAVAAVGGRVLFVHASVDQQKKCEPPCYASELRELGARGGQKLGAREGEPRVFAVGPTHAVWGHSGLFEIENLSGGVKRVVSTGGERAALDETHAYFAGRDLTRVDLASGASETLVTGINAIDVALDEQSVYFVEGGAGTIWRMLKAGGARTPIAKELKGARRITVARRRVYVACEADAAAASVVWDVAVDGTDKRQLASFQGRPAAIGAAPDGVDLVTWSEGSPATLHALGPGKTDELRRFTPPSYSASSPGARQAEPSLASTDRYVYLSAARGLIRVERQ